MEHPRTQSARANDDSALIESMEPGASQSGASGGNLARDIASDAEQGRVDDPESDRRVRKEDSIDHGERRRHDRPRG